jgi:hypothetical protein
MKSEPGGIACLLRLVNDSDALVSCFWLNDEGKEILYHELQPGHAQPQRRLYISDLNILWDHCGDCRVIITSMHAIQICASKIQAVNDCHTPPGTYTTHPWRLRSSDGRIIGEYCGASAELRACPDGSLVACPLKSISEVKPEWGQYKKRAEALGISIMAYDCVKPEAVEKACHILDNMLRDTPKLILNQLAKASTQVAIIGRNQVGEVRDRPFASCQADETKHW